MIVVDKKGHLASDDFAELHCFAVHIGLKIHWFQDHPRHPHYDLTTQQMKSKAIRAGAKLVTSKELIRVIKKND